MSQFEFWSFVIFLRTNFGLKMFLVKNLFFNLFFCEQRVFKPIFGEKVRQDFICFSFLVKNVTTVGLVGHYYKRFKQMHW